MIIFEFISHFFSQLFSRPISLVLLAVGVAGLYSGLRSERKTVQEWVLPLSLTLASIACWDLICIAVDAQIFGRHPPSIRGQASARDGARAPAWACTASVSSTAAPPRSRTA